MKADTDTWRERLRNTPPCRADVEHLAEAFASTETAEIEAALRDAVHANAEHRVSLLLLACGAAGHVIQPRLLCDAFGLTHGFDDAVACVALQGRDAVPVLLETAGDEHNSPHRQAIAVRMAAELALRRDADLEPVRRAVQRLLTRMVEPPTEWLLNDTMLLLDGNKSADFVDTLLFPHLLDRDPLQGLPERAVTTISGNGAPVRRPIPKLGRNEPCHCGSGKKYKRCCYEKDRETLRDASNYEGITRSELAENPGLVDAREVIEDLRPHQIAALIPDELGDHQLLVASRRAAAFGHRRKAFDILREAQRRADADGAWFDVGHFEDLLGQCLAAGDLELAREVRVALPEDALLDPRRTAFEFDILEHRERYEMLEALCRRTLEASERDQGAPAWDNEMLDAAHGLAPHFPALGIALARAAMIESPERELDSAALLDVIREARADLGLSPWDDPAEDLLEQAPHVPRHPDRTEHETESALHALRTELEQAHADLETRTKKMREMEEQLATLSTPAEPEPAPQPAAPQATTAAPSNKPPDTEAQETIARLRRQVQNMKAEIGTQQDRRRELRRQLSREQTRVERLAEATRNEEEEADEGAPSTDAPFGRDARPERELSPPVFTDAFREQCRALPRSTAEKALRFATGFALGDPNVWQHTRPVEARSGLYRVRIGIHYRMLIAWNHGETPRVIDLVPREKLDTWLRRHTDV